MNIRRILVPTDFSADSKLALEKALDLARQFNAEVHVLHVVEIPLFSAYPTLSMSDVRPDLHVDQAREKLKHFVQEAGSERLGSTVLAGHAPEVIVEFAAAQDMDLIVIATHGLRGLAHLLMGSTTERVIRMTSCPVLVIRHPDRPVAGTPPTAEEASPRSE